MRLLYAHLLMKKWSYVLGYIYIYIYKFFFFLVNKNGGIYGYITPLGRASDKSNLWLLSVRDFNPIKDAHQWTPASSGTRI